MADIVRQNRWPLDIGKKVVLVDADKTSSLDPKSRTIADHTWVSPEGTQWREVKTGGSMGYQIDHVAFVPVERAVELPVWWEKWSGKTNVKIKFDGGHHNGSRGVLRGTQILRTVAMLSVRLEMKEDEELPPNEAVPTDLSIDKDGAEYLKVEPVLDTILAS